MVVGAVVLTVRVFVAMILSLVRALEKVEMTMIMHVDVDMAVSVRHIPVDVFMAVGVDMLVGVNMLSARVVFYECVNHFPDDFLCPRVEVIGRLSLQVCLDDIVIVREKA
jgi:hypothetical protein